MSNLDLDAIEARAEAATPGPWTVPLEYLEDDKPLVADPDGLVIAEVYQETDIDFICAARTDIPALVAEVRRLEADIAKLERDERVLCPRCGKKGATYGPDPYASDINDDDTPVWECGDCRHESAMDI